MDSPFKCSLLSGAVNPELTVNGELPDWLKGRLIRTAPALFRSDGWRAEHWFDAIALLYSFSFEHQSVRYHQRLLQCDIRNEIFRGNLTRRSWGTHDTRGFWKRIFGPKPRPTDNTNVNIQCLGKEWVALTETSQQLVLDPVTLETLGYVHYKDNLPEVQLLCAHLQRDIVNNVVITVGVQIGLKSRVIVFEQKPDEMKRRIVAQIPVKQVPYIHSFNVTPSKVILFFHPFKLDPKAFVWSKKPIGEQFQWREDEGTEVIVVDRTSGQYSAYSCERFFVFHSINAFEDGDETIVDLLAYEDASLVSEEFRVENMERKVPDLRAESLRLKLVPSKPVAHVKRVVGDHYFEFPSINLQQKNGLKYRYIWGVEGTPRKTTYASTLRKFDVETSESIRIEDGYVYGEPLFVADPKGGGEDQGVILSVGTHPEEERSRLQILDARTMMSLASVDVTVSIPLGFHGAFELDRS